MRAARSARIARRGGPPAFAPVAWLGLLSILSILRVAPLVLDNRDPEAVCSSPPEVNDVRETSHQTPANIPCHHHPSLRLCGDSKHLPFELVNESRTQSRRSLFV